jgi:hypothetical protein
MKRIETIISFIVMLCAFEANSQITINGKVITDKGDPIPGVNVFFENSYDGASSDSLGNFKFNTFDEGKKTLIASFIGYKTWTKEVDLPLVSSIVIELHESVNSIDAVTITAGSFAAADESRASIMKPLDIYTTPSAVGDVMGAIRTMPGTQTSADDGRLLVRGGDAYESSTYIDGLVVANPYYSKTPDVATRGRFSPSLFDGVQFNTGGYSAEYGQALSSVLLLNSSGLETKSNTGFSLMSLGGELNHTFCSDNSSLMFSGAHYNYELYDKLFKSNLEWEKPVQSYNGSVVYRFKPRPSGMLKVYLTTDYGKLSYRTPTDDTGNKMLISNQSTTTYANVSYRDCISEKLCYKMGVSSSFQNNKMGVDEDDIKTKENEVEARFSMIHYFSDVIKINWGFSETFKNYDQDYVIENDTTFNGVFNDFLTGGFIESEMKFSKNFAIRSGVRGEYSSVIDMWNFAPRLALALKTGEDSQLSAAWGVYYQTPQADYLKYTKALNYEKAIHYIVSYQFGNASERLFRAEAYYKTYKKLITYNIGEYNLPDNLQNNGSGYASGIDVFWRDQKSIKGLDYWITYSYIDTKRKYQYYPEKACPSFISDHNFSTVAKYWINKLSSQIGASFTVASGKPYNSSESVKFNDKRTKAYTDLSLNLSHVFYIKNQYSVLYCSVNNVLGNNSILNYRTSWDTDTQGVYKLIPIRRNFKRVIFLGLFINL